MDEHIQQLEQHCLPDADKEVGQVALQIAAGLRPVVGDAAREVLGTLGGIQGAASRDAGAAVDDEGAQEAIRDAVVQQVVHDAVREGRSPDLAGLRVQHHEALGAAGAILARSEEHTSELQSLMRISYAVFCLKKKKN